jgi:hypothetical protein
VTHTYSHHNRHIYKLLSNLQMTHGCNIRLSVHHLLITPAFRISSLPFLYLHTNTGQHIRDKLFHHLEKIHDYKCIFHIVHEQSTIKRKTCTYQSKFGAQIHRRILCAACEIVDLHTKKIYTKLCQRYRRSNSKRDRSGTIRSNKHL